MRIDGDDLDNFNKRLLGALSLDPTPWRLEFLREWARWEGTGASYNPFATTWEDPTLENSANPWWNTFQDQQGREYHVRNYRSLQAGIDATVRTILQPAYYATLRGVLSRQAIGAERANLAADIRTWGTTGFASKIADGWEPPTPAAPTSPEHIEELTGQLIVLMDQVDRLNAAVLARFEAVARAGAASLDGATLASIAFDLAADPADIPWPHAERIPQ